MILIVASVSVLIIVFLVGLNIYFYREKKRLEINVKKRQQEFLEAHLELAVKNEEIVKQKNQLSKILSELQKSEEKLLAIFDNTVVGISIVDKEGKFTFANKTFADMLGYTSEELYKFSYFDIIYHEDLAKDREDYINLMNGKLRNYRTETRFVRKDRTTFWGNYSISPIQDQEGKIDFVIGIVVDIGDIKLTEQKLRVANEALGKAIAAKDKFFSIIAHDLKNPLTALLLSSETLLVYFDQFSRDKKKRAIDNIHEAGRHLERLLENLLQWARSQTGRLEYKPSEINLAEIIDRVVSLLSSSAKIKNIRLNSEIEEDIIVYADENMLQTIIRNLMSNAIKFTHRGGEVTVKGKILNGYVEIAVIDNGVGISEEDIDKLFRIDLAFSKSGTNKETGTGLGLILCKEFVERHGGKIWVESQLDKGSEFRFTLPINSRTSLYKQNESILW